MSEEHRKLEDCVKGMQRTANDNRLTISVLQKSLAARKKFRQTTAKK